MFLLVVISTMVLVLPAVQQLKPAALIVLLCGISAGLTACDSNGVSVLPEIDSSTQTTDTSVSQPVPPQETGNTTDPEPEEVPLPAIVPVNPTIADITDLVLITGQSNALGAGTAYDYTLDTMNDRSFAYTEDGWQVADLHQVWDRGWFPRTTPGSEPSNNFSLHFGKGLAERDAARVVGFVLITAPGQPISYWDVNGDFFNQIRNKVSNAINELPSKSSIDGILWHQGESDGRDDDSYSDALYQLIEHFRSESWFAYSRPFICGETAELPVNEQLRKLNRDNDPWTACIEAEGLETRDDGAHFSAKSLRLIGDRYAAKYFQMTR